MCPALLRLRPPDALESALTAAADLDRPQLEQLRDHVAALLEALPAPEPAMPPAAAGRRSAPPDGAVCGPPGGGYLEWKRIPRKGNLYGPYPYWRVQLGGRRRSFYLRGLAQAARAAPTD